MYPLGYKTAIVTFLLPDVRQRGYNRWASPGNQRRRAALGRILDEDIERVRDATDLVSLVSETVVLKQKGRL